MLVIKLFSRHNSIMHLFRCVARESLGEAGSSLILVVFVCGANLQSDIFQSLFAQNTEAQHLASWKECCKLQLSMNFDISGDNFEKRHIRYELYWNHSATIHSTIHAMYLPSRIISARIMFVLSNISARCLTTLAWSLGVHWIHMVYYWTMIHSIIPSCCIE